MKIEDLITNAPQEIKKNREILEERYSFNDVKKEIREFIKTYKVKGYLIYWDFPNLLRVSKGDLKHIVGEFTPYYVRYISSEFKEELLSFPKVKKFKEYLSGQVKLRKIEE